MFRFAFLLAVPILMCAAKPQEDLPVLGVIGGALAKPGQFPFQVSIEINGRQHCGGSLIAYNVVLTAAHCLYGVDINTLTVLAGTNDRLEGGQRVKPSQYIIHEFYESTTHAYDIAIIELATPFQSDTYLGVATLPDITEVPLNNAVGTVSGWGAEYHKGPTTQYLKFVNIPLWSYDYCKQVNPNLPHTHLCAGDISGQRNSCPGDSGGPLSQGNKVIGVVSSGFGCGAIFAPAMYTYVAGLRDWIQTHAGV